MAVSLESRGNRMKKAFFLGSLLVIVSLYSLYYNSAGAPRTASPAFALSALP